MAAAFGRSVGGAINMAIKSGSNEFHGNIPDLKSCIRLEPDSVQLSAFWMKRSGAFELKIAELEGEPTTATVELGLPAKGAVQTNLLGSRGGRGAAHASETGLQEPAMENSNVRALTRRS